MKPTTLLTTVGSTTTRTTGGRNTIVMSVAKIGKRGCVRERGTTIAVTTGATTMRPAVTCAAVLQLRHYRADGGKTVMQAHGQWLADTLQKSVHAGMGKMARESVLSKGGTYSPYRMNARPLHIHRGTGLRSNRLRDIRPRSGASTPATVTMHLAILQPVRQGSVTKLRQEDNRHRRGDGISVRITSLPGWVTCTTHA